MIGLKGLFTSDSWKLSSIGFCWRIPEPASANYYNAVFPALRSSNRDQNVSE
jgi:hypothetical protein